MRSPKIAIITKSMLIGYGVDEIVHFLSNKLSKQGLDITVFTSKSEYPNPSYETRIYDVARLPLSNEFWDSNLLPDFRSLAPLALVLNRYGLIVTVDPMHVVGALAKILYGKKVMAYYFGIPPTRILNSAERKAESIRQIMLWNLSFSFMDTILTNSKYTKSLLPLYLRRKGVVNYHGIEHLVCPKPEKAKRFRKELDVGNRILILSVGRFSTAYKGMAEVVKVFDKLQESGCSSILLLVGRGSIADLKIYQLPENIRMLSKVSFDTLRLCFAACDIYCTCSRWEGFNLPLAAAQANGRPAVAYDLGAHREIIADGKTGFLVKDVSEFVYRTHLLIKNAELRRKLGASGKSMTEKFSWERSAVEFEQSVLQVCTKP